MTVEGVMLNRATDDINSRYNGKVSLCTQGLRNDRIDWSGISINLCRSGPIGNAPQILLLHGVTYSSTSVFHLQVDGQAPEEYSMILKLGQLGIGTWALDFSGYGLSDTHPNQKEETIKDYVDQVRCAVEHIHQQSGQYPVVAGWSWGAQVASLAVAKFPNIFSGLIFWSGIWGGSGKANSLKMAKLPIAHRRINTTEHAGADFSTPLSFTAEVKAAFVKKALMVDPSSPTTGIRETIEHMPLHDPLQITIPTLVIQGENDAVVNPDDITAYYHSLASKNVHYEVISADHNAQFSNQRFALVQSIENFTHGCWAISNK